MVGRDLEEATAGQRGASRSWTGRGFKAVHLYIIRCNPPSKDFSKNSHYVSSLWKAKGSLKYVNWLGPDLKAGLDAHDLGGMRQGHKMRWWHLRLCSWEWKVTEMAQAWQEQLTLTCTSLRARQMRLRSCPSPALALSGTPGLPSGILAVISEHGHHLTQAPHRIASRRKCSQSVQSFLTLW